jgi:hypothetical protein
MVDGTVGEPYPSHDRTSVRTPLHPILMSRLTFLVAARGGQLEPCEESMLVQNEGTNEFMFIGKALAIAQR